MLYVRALLTFNPSARRYALKHPTVSLYRDHSASISHLRGRDVVHRVTYLPHACVLGPRPCARAPPGCEDAAGKTDALPAHGPILSPRYKHAKDVEAVEHWQHSRAAAFQNSTCRKTSRCPLATTPGQSQGTHPCKTRLRAATGPAPERIPPSADHQAACTAAHSRFSTTPTGTHVAAQVQHHGGR